MVELAHFSAMVLWTVFIVDYRFLSWQFLFLGRQGLPFGWLLSFRARPLTRETARATSSCATDKNMFRAINLVLGDVRCDTIPAAVERTVSVDTIRTVCRLARHFSQNANAVRKSSKKWKASDDLINFTNNDIAKSLAMEKLFAEARKKA